MGQSVRTRKLLFALSPEVSPVAVMSCWPGKAVAGIFALVWKAPEGSVVALPVGAWSKVRSTVSEGPNPRPAARVEVVGGPTVRVSWTAGEAPEAGAAWAGTAPGINTAKTGTTSERSER